MNRITVDIEYKLDYGMSPANLARQYGWRIVKVTMKNLKIREQAILQYLDWVLMDGTERAFHAGSYYRFTYGTGKQEVNFDE